MAKREFYKSSIKISKKSGAASSHQEFISFHELHLMQLADEKHSLLIGFHLVERLQQSWVRRCHCPGKTEQKMSLNLSKKKIYCLCHLAKCPSFSLCKVCSLHLCLHSSTAPFRNIFTQLETLNQRLNSLQSSLTRWQKIYQGRG